MNKKYKYSAAIALVGIIAGSAIYLGGGEQFLGALRVKRMPNRITKSPITQQESNTKAINTLPINESANQIHPAAPTRELFYNTKDDSPQKQLPTPGRKDISDLYNRSFTKILSHSLNSNDDRFWFDYELASDTNLFALIALPAGNQTYGVVMNGDFITDPGRTDGWGGINRDTVSDPNDINWRFSLKKEYLQGGTNHFRVISCNKDVNYDDLPNLYSLTNQTVATSFPAGCQVSNDYEVMVK